MPGLYDQLNMNNQQLPLDDQAVQDEKQKIKMRNRLAGIQASDQEIDSAAREAVAKKGATAPLPEEMTVNPDNTPASKTPAPEETDESKGEEEPEEASAQETPASSSSGLPDPKLFRTQVTSLKDRQAKLDAVSDKLPEDKQAVYKDKLATLNKAIKDSEDRYAEREDRINWAQAADIIGQAVTQMAAGYYGLQHGYDMSGVKFNKLDWEKKLDRLFDRYDKDVNRYTKQAENIESEQGAAERAQGKYSQEERESLRRQFEKEDDNQRRLQELQATLSERDARGEDTLRTKMEIAKLQAEMKAGAQAGKAGQQQDRETARLGDELQNIEKTKGAETRIKQKETILSRLGASPEDIARIKSGNDKIFTTDSERDERLTHAIQSKLQERSNRSVQPTSVNAAPVPGNNPTTGGKLRVKKITTGQTGTIDANDFDPAVYQKL